MFVLLFSSFCFSSSVGVQDNAISAENMKYVYSLRPDSFPIGCVFCFLERSDAHLDDTVCAPLFRFDVSDVSGSFLLFDVFLNENVSLSGEACILGNLMVDTWNGVMDADSLVCSDFSVDGASFSFSMIYDVSNFDSLTVVFIPDSGIGISFVDSVFLDVSEAPFCGNNILDFNEECDGSNLDGESCLTQGFDGGQLRCGSNCVFDVSRCYGFVEDFKVKILSPGNNQVFGMTDEITFMTDSNDFGGSGDYTCTWFMPLGSVLPNSQADCSSFSIIPSDLDIQAGNYVVRLIVEDNINDVSDFDEKNIVITNNNVNNDCVLNNVFISSFDNFSGVNDYVMISGYFSGDCSDATTIQVDAKSTDGSCYLEFVGGDMSGITGLDLDINNYFFISEWRVPDVSIDCINKTVYGLNAAFWNGLPGSGIWIGGVNSDNIYGTVSFIANFPIEGNTVFVTSTSYNGNLGGVNGADMKCQASAEDAGLPNSQNYLAWLASNEINDPESRFIHSDNPYVLINGTKIADNWDDLVDEELYAAINVDEYGNTVDDYFVWANVDLYGSFSSGSNCNDWLSSESSNSGLVGEGNRQDYGWTNYQVSYCDNFGKLYCFVVSDLGCSLNSVTITTNHSPSSQGDSVTINGVISGDCSGADTVQVDASNVDGSCHLEFEVPLGDMSGITNQALDISFGDTSFSGSWVVPSIPDDCKGEIVIGDVSKLWNGDPGVEGIAVSNECYDIGGSVEFEIDLNEEVNTVFVTSTSYNGNLGGVNGADMKCQASAEDAGLPNSQNYLAWLASNEINDPESRFIHSDNPYVLINGTKIADNWDDLVDEELYAAINVDEYGNTVDDYFVWANVDLYGSFSSGSNCNDWLSSESSNSGLVGEGNRQDYGWTNYQVSYCDNFGKLYCFEQEENQQDPFTVTIESPENGEVFDEGQQIYFIADYENAVGDVDCTWTYNDILFEDNYCSNFYESFPEAGNYLITITAEDNNGEAIDSVTIIIGGNQADLINCSSDYASWCSDLNTFNFECNGEGNLINLIPFGGYCEDENGYSQTYCVQCPYQSVEDTDGGNNPYNYGETDGYKSVMYDYNTANDYCDGDELKEFYLNQFDQIVYEIHDCVSYNKVCEQGECIEQTYNHFFEKTFGPKSGISIDQTSEGGYIIGGYSGSGFNKIAKIIKTDSFGNLLWSHSTNGDIVRSVVQTNDGNYIFVSSTYLVKINSLQGYIMWSKDFSDIDNVNSLSIVQQTNDGGYIIGGTKDMPQGSGQEGELYIAKTDSSGNLIWSNTFDHDGQGVVYSESARGIIQAGDDYVILSNTISESNYATSAWLIKISAGGNEIWNKLYYGGDYDWDDYVSSFDKTDNGYIIAGLSLIGPQNNPHYALWVYEVDNQGSKLWEEFYDYISIGNNINDIKKVNGGYILVGECDAGGLLFKISEQGTIMWNKTFGDELSSCVYSDNNDAYIATGQKTGKFLLIKTDLEGI